MQINMLMIEDDVRILDITQEYLKNYCSDWVITTAQTGTKGLELAQKNSFDIILLDVMLPGMDGFSVCKKLRETSNVPILFLTARVSEKDILNGYAVGGDDYITKPFSLAQLAAKLSAILSRLVREDTITCGKLTLIPAKAVIHCQGQVLRLPYKEYEILKYFMEHPNTLITKETLLVSVWDWDADVFDRVLDNHIKNIRKMIKNAEVEIITIRKQGYRMEVKQ